MTRTYESLAESAVLAATLLTSVLGCDASSSHAANAPTLASMDVVQWKLPKRLHEISGLAASDSGRVFAHDDERGIVYELDPNNGRLTKTFSLGDPPIREDFEGIAVAGGDIYLMTSDGILYRTHPGADGEHVDYEAIQTRLGADCELEGLAYDSARALLLASCKAPRRADLAGRVAVFAWSVERRARDVRATFTIDERALAEPIGAHAFNPSSVEIATDGSSCWLLAGRQRALAHVDFAGRVISVEKLPKGHRQPEGLTFGTGGTVIIADEGGDGTAMLSIYRPR